MLYHSDCLFSAGLCWLTVQYNHIVCNKRMGYMRPSFHWRSLATLHIFNHTLDLFQMTHRCYIALPPSWVQTHLYTNWFPPNTVNTAPPGGPFGLQPCPDDSLESSDNSSCNASSKDHTFRKHTNQFYPPPVHGYSPSQSSFPGTSQFCHHSPFNMTPSVPARASASAGFPSYGPPWQEYKIPQGGYGGSQIIPPPQFTRQALSSPDALQLPPALPGNNPLIPLKSSSSTPIWSPSDTPGKSPLSLWIKTLQPAVYLPQSNIAIIEDFPPLQDHSDTEYDVHGKTNDLANLGSAEGEAPISLKQMEFLWKQFAEMMGQPNHSVFNKWKKEWGAWCLGKKHQGIIQSQKHLEQLQYELLHTEKAVMFFFITFKSWRRVGNFDNVELIGWQWMISILKKFALDVQEVMTKGWQGNKRPEMDLGEHPVSKARRNLIHCPMNLSRLWLAKCQVMPQYPPITSKHCIQIWGPWRSWLISLKQMEAQNNHIV